MTYYYWSLCHYFWIPRHVICRTSCRTIFDPRIMLFVGVRAVIFLHPSPCYLSALMPYYVLFWSPYHVICRGPCRTIFDPRTMLFVDPRAVLFLITVLFTSHTHSFFLSALRPHFQLKNPVDVCSLKFHVSSPSTSKGSTSSPSRMNTRQNNKRFVKSNSIVRNVQWWFQLKNQWMVKSFSVQENGSLVNRVNLEIENFMNE